VTGPAAGLAPAEAGLPRPGRRGRERTSAGVRRRGGRLTLGSAGRIAFLTGLALYFVLPMIWMLLAPSKTHQELIAENPYAFGSFGNYALAFRHLLSFNNGELYRWIVNSAVYTAGSVALSVVTCVPAGYALALTDMRGRRFLLIATLVAMVTPGAARTIPLYLELSAIHFTNTAWAVILPAGFFPFGVYLCYIYFSTSLPRSVLEAARIDGASELVTFFRVSMPLARPVLGLIVFFSFVGSWNDYFLPYVMLSSDQLYNLPVGLGTLIASAPGIIPGVPSTLPIYQPEVALAGLLIVVPIIAIFLACQRFLTKGLLDGAVKD
jgi:multiple sugar transport system permease protein